MLFNHGLNPAELYTNTPKKINDKSWSWFKKRYGLSNSYEEAIADPFKYCFLVIMNKVLTERVRFKIPYAVNGYIDFEIITGDDFIEHRQNGRFQEVDFVESDFTGYGLRYYFNTKSYQKSYPIFVGGELKQKLLDLTNSGVKLYSVKEITINDIIPELRDIFEDFTVSELKRLIIHGFRRMHWSIKHGCAITINTKKFGNCYAFIGGLSLNPQRQIKEYSVRRDRKLRMIESWKKATYQGYYYVGYSPETLKVFMEENSKARVIVTIRNATMRRILKELFYKNRDLYIFKVKIKKNHGWAFWLDGGLARNIEYVGYVHNLNFTPDNKSWKEWKKEYEKWNDK